MDSGQPGGTMLLTLPQHILLLIMQLLRNKGSRINSSVSCKQLREAASEAVSSLASQGPIRAEVWKAFPNARAVVITITGKTSCLALPDVCSSLPGFLTALVVRTDGGHLLYSLPCEPVVSTICSSLYAKELRVLDLDIQINPAQADALMRSMRKLQEAHLNVVDGSAQHVTLETLNDAAFWSPDLPSTLRVFTLRASQRQLVQPRLLLDLSSLPEATALQELAAEARFVRGLDVLTDLQGLQSLHLDVCAAAGQMPAEALQALSQLQGLTSISLPAWACPHQAWPALAALQQLRQLHLRSLAVDAAGPGSGITSLVLCEALEVVQQVAEEGQRQQQQEEQQQTMALQQGSSCKEQQQQQQQHDLSQQQDQQQQQQQHLPAGPLARLLPRLTTLTAHKARSLLHLARALHSHRRLQQLTVSMHSAAEPEAWQQQQQQQEQEQERQQQEGQQHLRSLQRLQQLHVQGLQCSAPDALLQDLAGCPQLQELKLKLRPTTAQPGTAACSTLQAGLAALATGPCSSSLRQVDIDGAGGAGAQADVEDVARLLVSEVRQLQQLRLCARWGDAAQLRRLLAEGRLAAALSGRLLGQARVQVSSVRVQGPHCRSQDGRWWPQATADFTAAGCDVRLSFVLT